MYWTVLIPSSLFELGALLLLAAGGMQAITSGNSKTSLWLALVGGFGLSGVAGGWIGQALTSTTTQAMTWSGQLTNQLVGVSFPAAVFGIVGFIFWHKMKPSGTGLKSAGGGGQKSASGDTNGSSSGGTKKTGGRMSKAKQFGGLFVAACLGTALAAIPPLASWADTGVSSVHTAIASMAS